MFNPKKKLEELNERLILEDPSIRMYAKGEKMVRISDIKEVCREFPSARLH